MRKIFGKELVNHYIENYEHKDIFLGIDHSYIVIYEKGEFISSPFMTANMFQVVLSGSLEIYLVRDDGTCYSLSSGGAGYVLGDIEVFEKKANNIYVEAKSDVICIAISLDDQDEKLKKNADFMCFVAESLASKMQTLTKFDAIPASLEERVLSYLKYKCRDGVMKGIEQTSFRLHCSSRHLQRIMNKYLDEGIVEKVGKGSYRMKQTDFLKFDEINQGKELLLILVNLCIIGAMVGL